MAFQEDFDDVYAVVESACTDSVFSGTVECRRADQLERPGGKISEEILDAIRSADVVIADLTGANPNVMYELGFAHGLDRTTVLINQAVAESPFDVQGLRQIVYDRQRLMTNLRPLLLSTLRVALLQEADTNGSAAASESTPAATATQGPRIVNEDMILEIQSIHLGLEIERRRGDSAAVRKLAGELMDLLNHTVVSPTGSREVKSVVSVIGNCAVELELSHLYREAEDVYKRGIGLEDAYAGIRFQYADFLADQGRVGEATSQLERAKELDPTDRRALNVQMKLQLATGGLDEELGTALREAFEAEPSSSSRAFSYLAYLDRTGSDLEEFRRVCGEHEMALPPRDKWKARRALGDRLMKIDPPEAMGVYEQLLMEDIPSAEMAEILHNMAMSARDESHDRELAEQYWRRAYALDPTDPTIRAAFSQFLATSGLLDDAYRVTRGDSLTGNPSSADPA